MYLSLIIISAATLTGTKPPALVYSLVGLVFVTVMGIIVYHFHILYVVKSQMWLKFVAKMVSLRAKIKTEKTTGEVPATATSGKSSHDPHKIVTYSEIQLREPLL